MAKKIVVFGATGEQGKSVCAHLVKGGYEVVGITRNPDSASSAPLKAMGVIPAKGDLNDRSSYEPHLKGAVGAFVNADFWTLYKASGGDAEKAAAGEIAQAKNAIQAALDAGVKQVVYSTLDGGHDVDHWDSKQEVSKWCKANNLPVTQLYMTIYLAAATPRPQEDGSFAITLPGPDETVLPMVPVDWTGAWVKAAFDDPAKWSGKDMYAITDRKSLAEIAQILSEISGKKVVTGGMPKEYFLSQDFQNKLGRELWTNFKLFYDDVLVRDIEASRAIAPDAPDYRQWASQDKNVRAILDF